MKVKLSDFLTESRWCKDKRAKDKQGKEVSPYSEDAATWCLSGACDFLSAYDYVEEIRLMDALYRAIMLKYKGKYSTVPDFNDSPEVTYQDVRNLLLECQL